MRRDLDVLFRKLGKNIRAEFYPYADVKHSARKRNGLIFMRISDTFYDAPEEVLLSLGKILLAKLNRKPVDKKDRRLYGEYLTSERLQARASKILNRKKAIRIVRGHHKDLDLSFERVNSQYFSSSMRKPLLTWSVRRARRTLGRYDPRRDCVFISRLLDSSKIPDEFLDFIMYHELLHKKHGVSLKKGRRKIHTFNFKNDERKFRNYEAMKKSMGKIAGK